MPQECLNTGSDLQVKDAGHCFVLGGQAYIEAERIVAERCTQGCSSHTVLSVSTPVILSLSDLHYKLQGAVVDTAGISVYVKRAFCGCGCDGHDLLHQSYDMGVLLYPTFTAWTKSQACFARYTEPYSHWHTIKCVMLQLCQALNECHTPQDPSQYSC